MHSFHSFKTREMHFIYAFCYSWHMLKSDIYDMENRTWKMPTILWLRCVCASELYSVFRKKDMLSMCRNTFWLMKRYLKCSTLKILAVLWGYFLSHKVIQLYYHHPLFITHVIIHIISSTSGKNRNLSSSLFLLLATQFLIIPLWIIH